MRLPHGIGETPLREVYHSGKRFRAESERKVDMFQSIWKSELRVSISAAHRGSKRVYILVGVVMVLTRNGSWTILSH